MTILNCLGLKKLYKLDTSTSIHCKSFNKKLLTFLFIEPYITKQENSRLLYHIPTARGWVVPIFGPKWTHGSLHDYIYNIPIYVIPPRLKKRHHEPLFHEQWI